MTMMATIATDTDVLATLVAGLEREFGRGPGAALAARFLAAEEVDFIWDARVEERWLGRYESVDGGDGGDLDRVAVLARLGRDWIAGTLIVDGEGHAQGLIGRRDFGRQREAEAAYLRLS